MRRWLEQGLYSLYERHLLGQLHDGELPRHVGIILDGNRRFGRRRQIADPHELYSMGAAKLDHVLNWCTALGIPAVTLWVCSTKNLQRSAQEVSGILAAIQDKLADLATDPLVHQDRKSVVTGKSVSVRVDLGGRRFIKKKKTTTE